MKTLFRCSFLMVMITLIQGCSEDDSSARKSSAKFTFQIDGVFEGADLSRHSLFISIEDIHGQEVISDQLINFNRQDGSFTTTEIDLPSGQYTITDFRIALEDENIFAVPRKDELSNLMESALPFQFRVSDQSTISELRLKPAKEKKNMKFQLAVYIPESNKPVSAIAFLMLKDSIMATFKLEGKLNTLSFDLDPKTPYVLIVARDGYARFFREFIYDYFRTRPIRVDLTPAFTMQALATSDLDHLFEFELGAEQGTITVNWGDGTNETFTFTTSDARHTFTKLYAAPGVYPVTVTGNVSQILRFYSFYGHGQLLGIDFAALTALREVRLGLTISPPTIDLSHNLNIDEVRLPGLNSLTDLILPAVHQIDFIDISGPNNLSVAEVDQAINSIYTNALSHGILSGTISVAGSWWESPYEPLFIGPPSAVGMDQLVKLRDMYGWTVAPTF